MLLLGNYMVLTLKRLVDMDRVNRKTFWFKVPKKKKNCLEVPQSLKEEFLRMRVRCGVSWL